MPSGPKSNPPFSSNWGLKSSVGVNPVCWNRLRKKGIIFPWNCGWKLGSVIQVMINCCSPAGPIAATVSTSASVQGMPTRRSLILRQVGPARAGVNVVGFTVTPPASTLLLPPLPDPVVDEPPAPVVDEPPDPVVEPPPLPCEPILPLQP